VSIVSRVALALGMIALLGCDGGAPGTEPTADGPAKPLSVLGGVRGTADMVAGTLSFEPLSAPSGSRHSGTGLGPTAIYGDQGVTVRLYNSPVTITNPASPGKKTFSAPVGLRNLLAFPIGDEQAGGVPVDTMGIYVFVTSGPTVTGTSSPCSPACTVTAQNHHGTLAFSAPNQRYWHWGERVGAVGAGSDTTLARKTWIFEADTQVTSFRFDVLVSAAWPPPNDARWKIDYQGDSVPDTNAEPRWRRNAAGAAGTVSINDPSAGIITIAVPASARLAFLQNDSLGSATNAYIEARFRTNIPRAAPEVSFGIDDDVRFIGVGLTGTQVGFLTGTFTFLGTPVVALTTIFHVYQIRKFGADSVQLWMDGARIDSRMYTAFSASIANLAHFFYFGGAGTGFPPLSAAGNSSSWDYVIYEIGVSQP
jgi:hypothetical protein